jgi:hypothetical protein
MLNPDRKHTRSQIAFYLWGIIAVITGSYDKLMHFNFVLVQNQFNIPY